MGCRSYGISEYKILLVDQHPVGWTSQWSCRLLDGGLVNATLPALEFSLPCRYQITNSGKISHASIPLIEYLFAAVSFEIDCLKVVFGPYCVLHLLRLGLRHACWVMLLPPL